MNLKKVFIVFLMTSLALFLFAACSGDTTNEDATDVEAQDNGTDTEEESLEMVWAGWTGEEEASKDVIQSMIEDWNADNPNTQFSWVGWPWDNTLEQLIIRSQGGEALDVAQVDIVWLKALANAGVLEDLGSIVGEDWLSENIEEATLKTGQVDGVQYGIPWTTASIGMINNPSLLEAAGVEAVPETIDEFEAAMQKIKDYDSDIVPYALTTKGGGTAKDFMQWLWTFGGEVFDDKGNVVINSAAGVEALTWLKEQVDNGFISMDMDRFSARQMYATEKVAFYDDAILARGILESNGIAEEELDQKIEPMLRPVVGSGDTPRSVMWGHVLVAFKDSASLEKSAEFIKHLISEEQSLKYFEDGGLPPVMNSAISSPEVQEDAWTSEWLNITATGENAETIDYENSSELDGIISEELQAALLGDKTPEQALEDAASRLGNAIN